MTKPIDGTFDEAKLWDLPTVDDHEALETLKESQVTNVLNRPKNQWKYEAPEKEEDLKPLTAQEIESIRTAAYQEGLLSGHEEGFDKGHKEGLEKGQAEGLELGTKEGFEEGSNNAKSHIDEQIDKLRQLFDNAQTPTAQIDDDVKNEVVIMAINLAKAIIKSEVNQSQETILKAVNEGIALLPINEQEYQICLHEDDIAMLTEHLTEQYIHDNNWQLVASSDIARGGCKIHTKSNAVDVSIEKRCQQVFEQLLLNQGLADDPRAS
jgi:flagellar assembly protein FliH